MNFAVMRGAGSSWPPIVVYLVRWITFRFRRGSPWRRAAPAETQCPSPSFVGYSTAPSWQNA